MSKILKTAAKISGYGILGISGTASGTILALKNRGPSTYLSQFPDDMRDFMDYANIKNNPGAIWDYHEIRLKGYRPGVDTLVLIRGVFGGVSFIPQTRILQALYKRRVGNNTNNFINTGDTIWDTKSTTDNDWKEGVTLMDYMKLKSWDKQDGKILLFGEHPEAGITALLSFQTTYDKETDQTVLRMGHAIFKPAEDKPPCSRAVYWLHLIYAKLLLQDGSKYVEKFSIAQSDQKATI